jgi:uncharacterized YccA/Bax inhibitor family protein
MRTANPALSAKTFQRAAPGTGGVMTIEGTVNKTGFLLLTLMIPATWMWGKVGSGDMAGALPWVLGGLIGGIVFALVTIFKKTWAPFTAPAYAVCEGLLLGAVSRMYENRTNGIVIQAVALTAGTLLCLLLAYRSGMIHATENFKLGIVAATGAIAVVYLLGWVLRMFGIGIPYIHGGGIIGIGFSLVVVAIAALNLVLDFDFIERGSEVGAPKYMEWYAAFGLMVTLIWLYVEILRLLSKLNSRR